MMAKGRRKMDMKGKNKKLSKFLSFLGEQNVNNDESHALSCIICSQPKVKHEEDEEENEVMKNTERNEEDMLYFVTVKCLGFKGVSRKQIKTNGSSFLCDHHSAVLQRGLELESLIEKMMAELEMIKKSVQQEVEESIFSPNYDVDVDAFAADVKIECVDDVEFDFCEIDPLSKSKDEDWSILSINGRDTDENVQNAQNEESEKIDLNLEIRRSTRSTRKRQLPLPSSSPVHNFESEDLNNPNSDDLELKQEFDEEEVAPPPSPTLDYSEDESEDDTDWRHKAKKRKKNKPTNISPGSKIKSKAPRKRLKAKAKLKDDGTQQVSTEKKVRAHCHICNARNFPSYKERDDHCISEHGPGPYFKCDECPFKAFRQKCTLIYHIQRVHNASLDASFKCDQCPKKYKLKQDLDHHQASRHSARAKQILTCSYCPPDTGKKYLGAKNLSRHIQLFHNHKGPGFQSKNLNCEYCGKLYSSLQAFKQHKEKVHLNTYTKVICDVCGVSRSDAKSLKKHKLSQHSKAYQYRCSICGAGSLFKSHLIAHFKNSHSSTHSAEEIEIIIQNTKKVIDNTNPAKWDANTVVSEASTHLNNS